MLLDELLIKIGIDADSQAMREFEQFLNSVSDGTENAVDGLSSFAKSIEDIVSNATAQARDMPEFAEFFNLSNSSNKKQQVFLKMNHWTLGLRS